MDGMLQTLGLKEDEAIIHPWINKALEKAQAKVEARNFDIRKNLLKYDNVMNDQRKAIFEQRRELLTDADLSETVADMRHHVVDDLVNASIPEKSYAEQWDVQTMQEAVKNIFDVDLPLAAWAAEEGIGEEEFRERLIQAADEKTAQKAANIGPQIMRQIERAVLLQTLDGLWREHLVTLEHLRQVIGLRGYGQRDPLNEYKSESFTLFEHMLARLREAVTGQLAHVELAKQEEVPPLEATELPPMEAHHFDPTTGEDELALETAGAPGNGRGGARQARARKSGSAAKAGAATKSASATKAGSAAKAASAAKPVTAAAVNPADPSTWGKVQRNALCPCGSGKKYKHCHGTFG
jgi:preprotein translocase subunit SecA